MGAEGRSTRGVEAAQGRQRWSVTLWVKSIGFKHVIERFLGETSGLGVLCCANSSEEALFYSAKLTPGILIVDEDLFAKSLRAETAALQEFGRTIQVLVRIKHADEDGIEALLRMGCAGVLQVDDRPIIIRRALKAITAGQIWAPRNILSRLLRDYILAERFGLTEREAEILRLLQGGLTNNEIAASLSISPQTVRWHLRGLHRKRGIRERRSTAVRGRVLPPSPGQGDSLPTGRG